MALTFPLSVTVFADLLKMAPGTSWSLNRNDQLSGIGTGQVLAAELAGPLWTADVQTPVMNNAAVRQVVALVNALQGPMNPFYLYDPMGKYPVNDPTGTILAAATPTINSLNVNNKALRIAGLTAGFVIAPGDYFAFDYGSPARRALHHAVETVTADGSGLTPEFECFPYFRTGVTTGIGVTLLKPAAKVFIMPKTLKIMTSSAVAAQVAFSVMQSLAHA
jgi:hypothetical protein